MLRIVIMINLALLVKSNLYKVLDSVEDYSTNIHDVHSYFPKTESNSPYFPNYFLENNDRKSGKHFGFNVIYGIPDEVGTTSPYFYGLDGNNSSYYPEDGLYSSLPNSKQTPYEQSSIFSKHFTHSIPNYDGWSSEETEKPQSKKQEFLYRPNEYTGSYRQAKVPKGLNGYSPFPKVGPSRVNKYKKLPRVYGGLRNLPPKQAIYSTHQNYNLDSYPGTVKLHQKAGSYRANKPKSSKYVSRAPSSSIFSNSYDPASDYTSDAPEYSKFEKPLTTFICSEISENTQEYTDINLTCFVCVDNYGVQHQECINDAAKSNSVVGHSRVKREAIVSRNVARLRRQYEYYEPEDYAYDPYESDYRFGPEHFVDDEQSYDEEESSYESDDPHEKCSKVKKGEMMCITCENTKSGGTYEQCSYAPEPNKRVYEQSAEYEHPKSSDIDRRRYYGETQSSLNKHPPQLYHDSAGAIKQPRSPHYSNMAPRTNGYYPIAQAPVPQLEAPKYKKKQVRPPSHTGSRPYSIAENKYPRDGYGMHRSNTDHGKPYRTSDPSIPLYEYYDDNEEDRYHPASLEDEEGQSSISNKHRVEQNSPKNYYNNQKIRQLQLKRALNSLKNENNANCRKTIKNKMTCYECIDQKGNKQIECTYIKPGSTNTNSSSYHKVSKVKSTPKDITLIKNKVILPPGMRLVNIRGKLVPLTPLSKKRNDKEYTFLNEKDLQGGIRYARSSDQEQNASVPSNQNLYNTSSQDSANSTNKTGLEKPEEIIHENRKTNVSEQTSESNEEFPTTAGKFSKD